MPCSHSWQSRQPLLPFTVYACECLSIMAAEDSSEGRGCSWKAVHISSGCTIVTRRVRLTRFSRVHPKCAERFPLHEILASKKSRQYPSTCELHPLNSFLCHGGTVLDSIAPTAIGPRTRANLRRAGVCIERDEKEKET